VDDNRGPEADRRGSSVGEAGQDLPQHRLGLAAGGAVLAEEHKKWSTSRKYLDMAEIRTWKKRANGLEPETGDSTERQPVMAT